ncbi:hypothetical protein [Mailhella massiliensis]|uniref:hypothetical protein n=1 Tax=Mailhella massiliensis TaxID=1903261 RepID=UPI002357E2A8|nr:hypothetical protein [Mailhella massiliensis]
MLNLDFDYEERERIFDEKYEMLTKKQRSGAFWAALSAAYVEVFKELRNEYLKEHNYPTNDKKLNRKLRWDATMLAQIELQEMQFRGDFSGIPW